MFNHFTCLITGSIMNGSTPFHTTTIHEPWFKYALLMGAMFIAIFNVVGFATQKIGVAVASVAFKLSLVIPFIFSVYLYSEKISALKKSLGLWIALIAVICLLVCHLIKTTMKRKPSKLSAALLVIVPQYFFSSGLLDTLIKYVGATFFE